MRISTLEHWQAFGQTIKDSRVARGWPMRTFARMVGISHCYLCNLELAKVPPPSNAVLLKIAECLEIPYQTLFACAGRLPPTVLLAFWSHPAVPPVLSTILGCEQAQAQAPSPGLPLPNRRQSPGNSRTSSPVPPMRSSSDRNTQTGHYPYPPT